MGLRIATNVPSLNAQRNIVSTQKGLNGSFAKLSSGYRINQAADDAAGLAISESLKAKIRGIRQAKKNANDGISIISITDGAMEQITNSLTRLAELAEQSANGVYDTTQRSALQLEFEAVGSEIQRIAETTEFNGLKLLTQSETVTFQVGFDGFSNSQISFTGVQATLSAIGLATTSGSNALSFSLNDVTSIRAQEASRSALNAVQFAIDSLTRARGTLGSTESRLNITIENLQVARENFAAAESRIRDVDVAFEAAEMTRLNILQQAATSILAQANQQPQLALSLLQR